MTQIKVELQEFMGSDKSIAESAWTSSLTYQGKQKRTASDVAKVIKMLADSRHSTPFESVVLRFWIKMPIQTDRQHMTHRIGSHNGMSGRYRTMPNEWLDVPEDIISMNIPDVKMTSPLGDIEDLHECIANYTRLCNITNDWYSHLIKELKLLEKDDKITNAQFKRLREFYRGVLPQNNMTERTTIFNLRSFANYQKLRNSPHAQPEIQEVARQMLEAVKNAGICPIALEALEKNNWDI